MDNGLTHVGEWVLPFNSTDSARAAVAEIAGRVGASLCSDLDAADSAAVRQLSLACPTGATNITAWLVPDRARLWTFVYVSTGHGVLTLEVTSMRTSRLTASPELLEAVAQAAVLRYAHGAGPEDKTA